MSITSRIRLNFVIVSSVSMAAAVLAQTPAPENVYLTERVSITTKDGVFGFPPGTRLQLLARDGDALTVKSGASQFKVRADQVTADTRLAASLSDRDAAEQAAIQQQVTATRAGESRARSDQVAAEQSAVAKPTRDSRLPAAVAGSTAVKETARPNATSLVPSHISLDAHNIAAGRTQGMDVPPATGATRMTTSHTETVQITLLNLGTTPDQITIHWFWVGRYERSNNWFRSGDGDKTINIDPRQSQTLLAENTDIEAHETRNKRKNEHYKSGGNMLGWVVTASDSRGQIVATKTSDPALEHFVTNPPPKIRH